MSHQKKNGEGSASKQKTKNRLASSHAPAPFPASHATAARLYSIQCSPHARVASLEELAGLQRHHGEKMTRCKNKNTMCGHAEPFLRFFCFPPLGDRRVSALLSGVCFKEPCLMRRV